MVNSQTGKMASVFAVILAVMFGYYGFKSNQTLSAKATAQDGVTQTLEQWKQSYRALGESRAQWEKRFNRDDAVQDIRGLFGLVGLQGYGLVSDSDVLTLTKIEQVTQNNIAIGLTKICMGSGSADGGALLVQAPDYQMLLAGIDKLAKRPDLYIGNITVQGDKQIPVASLGEFCVLLRNH